MFEDLKVIAADIDGTLAKTAVSPSVHTIETITKLREKGILFGLASGRPADDVVNKYKLWNAPSQFDFIIGWNGCELYDFLTGNFYQYNKLKKEWIKEIIEFMAEFDANIHMYLPGRYIASSDTDKAWYSAYKNSRKYIGFNTQKDLLEFSHKDSNKGYALKQFCAMHDIDMNDVMAFGDTDNDNKMLQGCHGVCLKDGNPNTKKLAEFITDKDCYEDGFADFVERYVL